MAAAGQFPDDPGDYRCLLRTELWIYRDVNTNDSVMKSYEDSPFFYRCNLKAARQASDEKSESAGRERSGQSSFSGDVEASGAGRRDASGYRERDASGGFDGD